MIGWKANNFRPEFSTDMFQHATDSLHSQSHVRNRPSRARYHSPSSHSSNAFRSEGNSCGPNSTHSDNPAAHRGCRTSKRCSISPVLDQPVTDA
jgi:hypothetical protein